METTFFLQDQVRGPRQAFSTGTAGGRRKDDLCITGRRDDYPFCLKGYLLLIYSEVILEELNYLVSGQALCLHRFDVLVDNRLDSCGPSGILFL